MAASTWPVTLPQVMLIDGFAQALTSKNLIKSSMDTGPAKIRRRSTAQPRPMSGSMDLTSQQLQILIDFVNGELAGGSLPFTFPAQPPFVGTYLCRFDELPQWDWFAPGVWKVDFKLEILPGLLPEPRVP